MAPFLSVITRHMTGRKNMLVVNQASLRMQSDPDYEQLIEEDDTGRGWQFVLEITQKAADRAKGEYVIILDDDDILINAHAIRDWKEATNDHAPAVIHKSWIGDLGILPNPIYWNREPVIGEISCSNFMVRKDILVKHIHQIEFGRYENDFDLINGIYQEYGVQVIWLNQLMAWAMKRSFGKGE